MEYKKRENRESGQEEELLAELERYRAYGMSICMNGRPCRPDQVAARCLREHSSYMRDFVSDAESEQIIKVDFISVSENGSRNRGRNRLSNPYWQKTHAAAYGRRQARRD